MARSAELRQEAQAMSDVERVLAAVGKLPARMRGRVLAYAIDSALDAQQATSAELDAQQPQGGAGGGGAGGDVHPLSAVTGVSGGGGGGGSSGTSSGAFGGGGGSPGRSRAQRETEGDAQQ